MRTIQVASLPLNEVIQDFGEEPVSHFKLEDIFYSEYAFAQLESGTFNIATDNVGLYFIYCWQGDFSLSVDSKYRKHISPYQSVIVMDDNCSGLNITFQKGKPIQLCIIGCKKPKTNNTTTYTKCRDLYFQQLPSYQSIYVGRPYLKLLEKINHVSRLSKKNIAEELILEGLIYQIIGLKMKQLLEKSPSNEGYGMLSFSEIERLKTISDFIRENPALDYSIEFLCRETGVSPFKLQEGFKNMYNRTVIDFIRNVRLEKATELIKTTDLNISEIVYSIGLTSRSYFSKIFKKKYKCSPKFFQNQYKFSNRVS